jgi:polysaccharide export outer membrane protein
MPLNRGTSFIALLLIALSSAGCKTDDGSFNSPTSGSTADATSSATPWWKGRSGASSTLGASDGITPSFGSAGQTSANASSPRQQPQAVGDASIAKTADSLAAVSAPGSHAYRIGPLDILDISVFQAPELSKTVEVADNGMIDLPLIGETPAAGKTAQELQRDLNSKLGSKYLQNPKTTVTVKEFNSNRVTVSGAVKAPGVFPYKGETLYQFITMAGGLNRDQSNSMVLVLRQNGDQRSAAKFNVDDIATGRTHDPAMQAGDVIVADSSSLKTGYSNLLKVLPLAGFAALATL